MKKTLLITCFLFFLSVEAQSQVNFNKITLGAGLGPTLTYADVRGHNLGFAGYLNVDYNLTPFLTGGIEVQTGVLKGGNIITDPHNRQFKNNYKAISVSGKIGLGQFIGYTGNKVLNTLGGLYVGAGLGAIKNKMDFVVRYKPNTQTEQMPLGYEFPGEDKSTNLLIPLNLGINFYFKNKYNQPRYMLNLNFQNNFVIGEGLDGYNDPEGAYKNNNADFYALYSIGFRYSFGPIGLYSGRGVRP